MFLAIGDHTCDRNPIQVGQFESSDQLLVDSLATIHIEGKPSQTSECMFMGPGRLRKNSPQNTTSITDFQQGKIIVLIHAVNLSLVNHPSPQVYYRLTPTGGEKPRPCPCTGARRTWSPRSCTIRTCRNPGRIRKSRPGRGPSRIRPSHTPAP